MFFRWNLAGGGVGGTSQGDVPSWSLPGRSPRVPSAGRLRRAAGRMAVRSCARGSYCSMRVAPWFLPGACRGVRRGRIPTPGGAEASCVTRTPLGYAAGRAIGGRLSGGVRTGIFSVHTDRPKRAGAGAGVVVWKLRVPPGARTMRSATLSLPAGARRTPKAAGHLGQPSVGVRLSPGEPGAQSADCF